MERPAWLRQRSVGRLPSAASRLLRDARRARLHHRGRAEDARRPSRRHRRGRPQTRARHRAPRPRRFAATRASVRASPSSSARSSSATRWAWGRRSRRSPSWLTCARRVPTTPSSICPAAVVTNWVREVRSKSTLRPHRLHGPAARRAARSLGAQRWRGRHHLRDSRMVRGQVLGLATISAAWWSTKRTTSRTPTRSHPTHLADPRRLRPSGPADWHPAGESDRRVPQPRRLPPPRPRRRRQRIRASPLPPPGGARVPTPQPGGRPHRASRTRRGRRVAAHVESGRPPPTGTPSPPGTSWRCGRPPCAGQQVGEAAAARRDRRGGRGQRAPRHRVLPLPRACSTSSRAHCRARSSARSPARCRPPRDRSWSTSSRRPVMARCWSRRSSPAESG